MWISLASVESPEGLHVLCVWKKDCGTSRLSWELLISRRAAICSRADIEHLIVTRVLEEV